MACGRQLRGGRREAVQRLAIKFFFLEYDSPRAGDFAPLRFVPQDKTIVLGLVSTKTNALEDKSELEAGLNESN